jgi:hypothetical protein
MRLTLAAFLDRWESRVRRVGERIGYPQTWIRELADYLADPRLTLEEAWVRYALLRREARPRIKAIQTEAEALAFFRDCDYPLWRNVIHRRHTAWRRVLWTMKGSRGTLLELGCGTAPVSAYCAAYRPEWSYWLHDLDGPAKAYGCQRVREILFRAPISIPISGICTFTTMPLNLNGVRPWVVTALDVFEHLADPLTLAMDGLRALASEGYLHWNFVAASGNELNRATAIQRDATIRYIDAQLTRVWGNPDDHCVSRR